MAPTCTVRAHVIWKSPRRRSLTPGALAAIGHALPTRALTALALAGEKIRPTRVVTADRLSALRHFVRDGPSAVAEVAPHDVRVVNVRSLSTAQFQELQTLFPHVERVHVTLLSVILDGSPWKAPSFDVDFDHAIVFDRPSHGMTDGAVLAWATKNVAPRSRESVTLCVDVPERHELPPSPWSGPFACAVLIAEDRHEVTRTFLNRHDAGPVILCVERKYGMPDADAHAEYAFVASAIQADAAVRKRPVLVSIAPFPCMGDVLDVFASVGPNVMVVSENACITRGPDGAREHVQCGFDYEARYRGDIDDTQERALFSTFDADVAQRAASFVGVPPSVFLINLQERQRDAEIAAEFIEKIGVADHVLAKYDVTRATVVALARRAVLEPCPTDALTACKKVHALYGVHSEFFTYYPMRRPALGCKDESELALLNWCKEVSPDATFANVRGNFVFGYIKARMFRTARRIIDLGAPASSVFDRYTFQILKKNDDEQRALMLELLERAELEISKADKPRPMEFDRVRTFFTEMPEYIEAAFDVYRP